MSGRTAGQDGDVPLFHHFDAEVSSAVPSRIRSLCHSQTRHDFTAQTLLHLCCPQAAEKFLLWRHYLSQVGKQHLLQLVQPFKPEFYYFAQQCKHMIEVHKTVSLWIIISSYSALQFFQRTFSDKSSSLHMDVIQFIKLAYYRIPLLSNMHVCTILLSSRGGERLSAERTSWKHKCAIDLVLCSSDFLLAQPEMSMNLGAVVMGLVCVND